MKKIVLTLLLLLICSISYAGEPVKVELNNEQLQFENQPIIENGRTLVEMRTILEKLGYQIIYNEKNGEIVALKGNVALKIQIGSTKANVNGKEATLDVPAKVVNGRTMVPLRFFSENVGSAVTWDESTRTVKISDSGNTIDSNNTTDSNNIKNSNNISNSTVNSNNINVADSNVNNSFNTTINGADQAILDEFRGIGSVKGKISYKYNNVLGNRGDVGAKIFLFPVNFDKNTLNEKQALLLATIEEVPEGSGILYKTTNGTGDYELSNIKSGKYVALIISKNTTRNFTEPIGLWSEETLKKYIKNWQDFYTMQMATNKFKVLEIEVLPGRTIDVNHDFGISYL